MFVSVVLAIVLLGWNCCVVSELFPLPCVVSRLPINYLSYQLTLSLVQVVYVGGQIMGNWELFLPLSFEA